jgi:uncharacterized membrane protein YheB (UPF0754 family)
MSFVVSIVIGGAVGLVTKWVAIQMLFWPRQSLIIFGRRLPLTPGLFIRRREEFARAVGEFIENNFTSADDLYRLAEKAHRDGVIARITQALGPGVALVVNMYFGGSTPESFRRDCAEIAAAIGRNGVVRDVVRGKLGDMTPAEMESMIRAMLNNEFRFLIWFGGALGGFLAAVQVFLS